MSECQQTEETVTPITTAIRSALLYVDQSKTLFGSMLLAGWRDEISSLEFWIKVATVVISLIALAVSFFAFRHTKSERRRTSRIQLADVVNRLISVEAEIKDLDNSISNTEEDSNRLRPVRNIVRQQRDSLARQAHSLIAEIPEESVSDVEYAAVARALATDDSETADTYWNRALETSKGLGLGKHKRSYAQFLYSQQKFERGQAQFREAVKALAPGGDNHRWELMWTYLNWAECAAKKPGPGDDKSGEVNEHLHNARKICEQLHDQIRKNEALCVISDQEKKIRTLLSED
jgi:Tfp pilus assembly protein PilF